MLSTISIPISCLWLMSAPHMGLLLRGLNRSPRRRSAREDVSSMSLSGSEGHSKERYSLFAENPRRHLVRQDAAAEWSCHLGSRPADASRMARKWATPSKGSLPIEQGTVQWETRRPHRKGLCGRHSTRPVTRSSRSMEPRRLPMTSCVFHSWRLRPHGKLV